MSNHSVIVFLKISISYRKHFLLTLQDLDVLLRPLNLIYTGVESGKRTLTLALAEGIASVYGLSYCEMTTKNYPIPSIENLPAATKELVLERQSAGKKPRNEDLTLPKHVSGILNSISFPLEFTSSEIWGLLPNNIKSQIKSTRITDLFSKGELKDKIEYTGKKRGREKVYRLR